MTRQVDGVAAPSDYKELEELLRQRLEALTPTQRRIAHRLLSDPEGCAFLTVAQLADSADVDPSTVVRFATSLGLDGYPALARLCQLRLQEQAQLVERFGSVSYLESVEAGGLLARAAELDRSNIARTFAGVQNDDWSAAVEALSGARRVQTLGMRKSFAPAALLAYLLGLIRPDVQQLGAGHVPLPDGLRGIGPPDTLLAISIHRYVRSTVLALEYARSRGATTIAITDNAASPIASQADVVFYVEVSGASILRSVTAITSLVQALATAVAMELGTESRDALLLEEELLAEFDVYHAPPNGSEVGDPTVARHRATPARGRGTG